MKFICTKCGEETEHQVGETIYSELAAKLLISERQNQEMRKECEKANQNLMNAEGALEVGIARLKKWGSRCAELEIANAALRKKIDEFIQESDKYDPKRDN